MIVVSNTTPINYLLLVEQIHLLYSLYGQVIIPQAVYDELQSAGAPAQVQEWMSNLPHWIEVRTALSPDPTLNLNPVCHKSSTSSITQYTPLLNNFLLPKLLH